MKNILSFLSIYVVLILLQPSCKNSIESGIRLNINTNIYKSPILLRFVNANSSSTTVIPDNITVKITGKDAALVVTSDGGTSYKITGGTISLAINSDVIATPQAPINFTIFVQIPGFMPVMSDIVVNGNNPVQYIISALELANPANGVSVLSNQSTPLSSGEMSTTYTLSTLTSSTVTENAKLVFAAGTKMLDKDGNVISSSSNLTSDVIFFSTSSLDAVKAFPGGLTPQNVIGPDGNRINGGVHVATAGLLSVNMQASGIEVKGFSKPVAAAIELNAKQDNYKTGQPLKAGDSIPVWSRDENSGQWKYESMASVTSVGGKLVANFNVTHLSDWDVTFMFASNGSLFGGWICDNQFTIKVNTPWVDGFDFTLVACTGSDWGWCNIYNSTYESLYNGREIVIANLPEVPKAKIVAGHFNTISNKYETFETDFFPPCSGGSVDLNIPGPAPTYYWVKPTVAVHCTGGPTNAKIGCWITISHHIPGTYTGWQQHLYVDDNPIKSSDLVHRGVINEDSEYDIYAEYKNRLYSAKIIQTNGHCEIFNGDPEIAVTSSYSPSTDPATPNIKTLNLDIVITGSCK